MEENKSIWKNSINYGVILGLALIIFTVVLYVSGLMMNKPISMLSYLIIIAIIFIGIKKQRDFEEGFLSYGKGLASGTAISLIGGFIYGVFIFILYDIIDPNLIEKVYLAQEQELMSQGIPDSQIEMSMNMTKKFMGGIFMGFVSLLGTGFIGFIISLIISAILKKNKDIL